MWVRIRALEPGTGFTPGSALHRALVEAEEQAEKESKQQALDDVLGRYKPRG